MIQELEDRLNRLSDDFTRDEYMSQIEDYRYWGQMNKNNKYKAQFINERIKYIKNDYNNRPLTEFFYYLPTYQEEEAIQVIPVLDKLGRYKSIMPEIEELELQPITVLLEKYFRIKYIEETQGDLANKEVEEGEEGEEGEAGKEGEKSKEGEKKVIEETSEEIMKKIKETDQMLGTLFQTLPRDLPEDKLQNFQKAYQARLFASLSDLTNPLNIALHDTFSDKPLVNEIKVPKLEPFKVESHSWDPRFPRDKYPKVEAWMTEEEAERVNDLRLEKWNKDILKWVDFADEECLEEIHSQFNYESKTRQGNVEFYWWLRDLKAIDQSAQAHVYPLGNMRKHPKSFYRIRRLKKRPFNKYLKRLARLIMIPFKLAFKSINFFLRPFYFDTVKEKSEALKRYAMRSVPGMPIIGFSYLDSLPRRVHKKRLRQVRYERTKLKQAQLPFVENLLYEELKHDPQLRYERFVRDPIKSNLQHFGSKSGVFGLFAIPIIITAVGYLSTKYAESRTTLLHRKQIDDYFVARNRAKKFTVEDAQRNKNIAYSKLFDK